MLESTKKIALVVFLTLLIWVWADLSNDQELKNKSVTIRVAQNINPNLWVSLDGGESISVSIDLKGPASKIAELQQDTSALTIPFDPEGEESYSPDRTEYNLPTLPIVSNSIRLKNLGLSVEAVRPATMPVNVEKLVEKQLSILCVDQNNSILEYEKIDPSYITIPVPEHWEGDLLKSAKVRLTDSEIQRAQNEEIKLVPFVEIEKGRHKVADVRVTVKLPSKEVQMISDVVIAPRIGFIFNETLQGKYKVEVLDDSQIRPVRFRATDEARERYKSNSTWFHVLIKINNDDIQLQNGKPKEISREVIYNFPQEYLMDKEILPDGKPGVVRFRLVPIELEPLAAAK